MGMGQYPVSSRGPAPPPSVTNPCRAGFVSNPCRTALLGAPSIILTEMLRNSKQADKAHEAGHRREAFLIYYPK